MSNYEHRLNSDGTINSKYIDLLDEDKSVAGQKFACISFISPEKVIKQREMFEFEQFLKQWDMNKSLEKFRIVRVGTFSRCTLFIYRFTAQILLD